jgi:predicted enzyme related to lactoylglutathione lyase
LLYVAVDDVDGAADKIGELGGKIIVAPRDIPDVGRFAVAADPNGATFAIYKSAK